MGRGGYATMSSLTVRVLEAWGGQCGSGVRGRVSALIRACKVAHAGDTGARREGGPTKRNWDQTKGKVAPA